MNGTECFTGENAVYLNKTQIHITQIILFLSVMTIIISNSLKVAVIIKTLQFGINSTKLALHLSLCDICLAVFGLLPQACILNNKIPCTFKVITILVRRFFLFASKCLVVLISYDRYVHVKSPNRYSLILTTKKLRLLELMCFLATGFMTALSYINYNIIQLRSDFLIIPPVFTIIITVTYYYVKSIKCLNEHRLRRTAVSKNDKDITKYAKYILLIFGCFHFTSFGIAVINLTTNTQYKHFISVLQQPFLMHYSPINTICFFYANRKSKRYLKNLYRRYIKTSTIADQESKFAAILNITQNHQPPTTGHSSTNWISFNQSIDQLDLDQPKTTSHRFMTPETNFYQSFDSELQTFNPPISLSTTTDQ